MSCKSYVCVCVCVWPKLRSFVWLLSRHGVEHVFLIRAISCAKNIESNYVLFCLGSFIFKRNRVSVQNINLDHCHSYTAGAWLAQQLQYCAASFQIMGSNQTHTCICWNYFLMGRHSRLNKSLSFTHSLAYILVPVIIHITRRLCTSDGC